MKKVEIVYRYEDSDALPERRPADAQAAERQLDEGSRAFAAIFAGLGTAKGVARSVVHVDPRDLGLQSGVGNSPVQRPFAVVLGCADARVPIELIFNQAHNDLFVVRVAGNTLGDDVRGSIDYALEHLGGSLKLVVVLGHSGCGAVTAAVDVFLQPAGYLALTSQTAIRNLVDRLQVVVHACARRLEAAHGPEVVRRPGYREALIEMAVVLNAALAAHSLQREVAARGAGGVGVRYGVYLLSERIVWAPRCDSDEVFGLAPPPADTQGFVELSAAALRSPRMAALLGAC